MRKNILKCILLFVMFLCSLTSFSQSEQYEDPMAYLRKQCPKLTEMYKAELNNCHAHYIFAVDVSLSMCKFEEMVKPAMEAFVDALPNGDRVTIIPFAHDAEDNKLGYDVDIDKETKSSLKKLLPDMYPHGTNKKDPQYLDTDIYQAQKAVSKSMQQNAQYDVNVVVIISDLLHCPTNNIDRQFTDSEMQDMKNAIKSAKSDGETMVFTLELPQNGNPRGYVLDQLKEVYRELGLDIVQQKIPQDSGDLINQWFNNQKNRIMFTKLQTIILRENKANPIEVSTNVDIDGNVTAHVKWSAGKLYPKLTMDTTYIKDSDFYFKANGDYVKYSVVGEIDEEIELGKIKNKDWFFHKMNDTLFFDVKLPVEYQSEIDRLLEGRPGPLANASEKKDGWVWTFFMPLWLTALIAALILLYILGVFKAIGRNASYKFNGNITVNDAEGNQLGDIIKIKNQGGSLLFGQGGNPSKCKVDDAEWQFDINKKNGNIFLSFFAKPHFAWSQRKGYTCQNKNRSGILEYEGTDSVTLSCGASRSELSHKIKVKLIKPNK